ncbi:MAG: hypothetical protein KFW21_05810 [Spirochaetota bacterium]|nr:hypothetical protein [Spirochaetota bacterium]
MKKNFLLLLILIFSVDIYAQENTNTKPAFQLEFGVTAYSFNIAFGGFDLDFIIPFYTKGINTLSVKTSLITFVPSSIFQPVAPFILFGSIVELQYSLSTKRGFLFSLETGLGVASEFFQTPVFTLEKGFQDNFISQPYGIFSSGLRMGYDFNKKFMQPFKFAVFLGYRMQFPFNFTIKHFIMYGASLSYKFDFVGGKK